MSDAGVGDLVVVRFAPTSVAKLTEAAEDEFKAREIKGLTPHYAVSTFAGILDPEVEGFDDLVQRLCRDSTLTGRNIHVVTGRQLTEAGFRTERTEPPANHHDVVLGHTLRSGDVERLSAMFEAARRRNPLWKK